MIVISENKNMYGIEGIPAFSTFTGNYVTYIAGKRAGNFWPGSRISHERLIRDSVGGASVNGNIIKRPRDRITKGI